MMNSGTEQTCKVIYLETWQPSPPPFDYVYDVDDGGDELMIGFEHSPEHYALHRVLRAPLLKWAREFVARCVDQP